MVFKVQIFTIKLGSNQTCLAVIVINSVFKKDFIHKCSLKSANTMRKKWLVI